MKRVSPLGAAGGDWPAWTLLEILASMSSREHDSLDQFPALNGADDVRWQVLSCAHRFRLVPGAGLEPALPLPEKGF